MKDGVVFAFFQRFFFALVDLGLGTFQWTMIMKRVFKRTFAERILYDACIREGIHGNRPILDHEDSRDSLDHCEYYIPIYIFGYRHMYAPYLQYFPPFPK